MDDTDFITRHDAQVEYCKLCGMCKTPGKKELVENACIQCFPAKNPILEIPAADVRPVVRSDWIINDVGDNTLYAKCKHCLTTQVLYGGKQPTNFCPNCGADMRETGR